MKFTDLGGSRHYQHWRPSGPCSLPTALRFNQTWLWGRTVSKAKELTVDHRKEQDGGHLQQWTTTVERVNSFRSLRIYFITEDLAWTHHTNIITLLPPQTEETLTPECRIHYWNYPNCCSMRSTQREEHLTRTEQPSMKSSMSNEPHRQWLTFKTL